MPRAIGSKVDQPYVTPCRVCGGPTKHNARRLEGKISCENPECREASQVLRGKNIARANTDPASHATCRICGKLTNRHRSFQGLVSCDDPTCVTESRRLKNEAIRAAALARYASGDRPRANRWRTVPKVSPIETDVLGPTLLANGWTDQHKLVPGVRGVRAPRTYHLDFALIDKKLCVEIDGSSHRKKKQRLLDEKRDRNLAAIGWRTIRFTNEEVLADPTGTIDKILSFGNGNPIVIDPPQLCVQCGRPIPRSRRKTCGRECQSALHAETIRGRTVIRERRESAERDSRGSAILNRSWIPCRICGGPTKINGTPAHPRYHTTACDKPDCRIAAKELTRQNQSKALKGNQKLITSTQAAWDRRRST